MQSRKFAIVVFTNDLLQSMDLFVVAAACKLLIPARLSVPRQPAWAKYKSRSQSVSQLVLSSAFTLCRIVNNTHGFSSPPYSALLRLNWWTSRGALFSCIIIHSLISCHVTGWLADWLTDLVKRESYGGLRYNCNFGTWHWVAIAHCTCAFNVLFWSECDRAHFSIATIRWVMGSQLGKDWWIAAVTGGV